MTDDKARGPSYNWRGPAVLGTVFVIGFAGMLVFNTTPTTTHPVQSPGAVAITPQVVAQTDRPYAYGWLGPSTSLAEIRCEASMSEYQNRGSACPDATTPPHYWPALTQSPHTIYVGVEWFCTGSDNRSFNLEYFSGKRTLVIHCFSIGPWISFERPVMGVNAEPVTNLVVIPTDGISAGKLTLIRDDRVEHAFGDSSDESQLGSVRLT